MLVLIAYTERGCETYSLGSSNSNKLRGISIGVSQWLGWAGLVLMDPIVGWGDHSSHVALSGVTNVPEDLSHRVGPRIRISTGLWPILLIFVWVAKGK